ncbi:MAG: Gfo/Idh/MocA family oxidoreductase [Chloroflexi bacterium]|nr:Gfo/Idh/MocA family oxidoreductase [Chloroflexota bacterium]
MSVIRFGVIGCGEISAATCVGLAASPITKIAMLMDTRPETLNDLHELYGAPTTQDAEDVFANPDVDAVYIATPHDTHVPLGIRAAQAGKHVLMEKPIATTLADADKLINVCREAGVKLGVSFYNQVDGGQRLARDMILGGMIGDVTAVRLNAIVDKPAHYWQAGYTQRVSTDWRTKLARAGGGVLIMNVIHDLNAIRFVTGLEVTRLYAESDTLSTPVEVEDTVGVVMRYNNGAIGVIQAGSAMRGGEHECLTGPRIYGTKGQIILNPSGTPRYSIMMSTEPGEGFEPGQWRELVNPGRMIDRQAIEEGFARAILEDTPPPCTGEDARRVLEIVLASYESARLHQPVALPL